MVQHRENNDTHYSMRLLLSPRTINGRGGRPPPTPRMRSLPSTVAGMLREARDHRRCPDVRWKFGWRLPTTGIAAHTVSFIPLFIVCSTPLEPGFDPEGIFWIHLFFVYRHNDRCLLRECLSVDADWIEPSLSEDDDWDKYWLSERFRSVLWFFFENKWFSNFFCPVPLYSHLS